MKNLFFASALAIAATSIQAQVRMPQPSPTQTISQEFGMGKIELSYSRPTIKGRSILKEKSDLAPLNQMWRLGANAATKVKFTDFVSINGNKLDTGSYVLYAIPGAKEWEIVVNKGLTNWGTDGYKKEQDVARFKVPTIKIPGAPVESFTMQIANVKAESCELHIMWANTAVSIPVTTDIKDKLRMQIETALASEKKPFYQAATFYYEWDKNNTKALENISKAIEANPKGFWMYLLKAKIEKDLGKNEDAVTSAKKCAEIAAEAKNDDYVKQANDLIKTIK